MLTKLLALWGLLSCSDLYISRILVENRIKCAVRGMFVLHATIDRTRRNHCYARYEMQRDPIEVQYELFDNAFLSFSLAFTLNSNVLDLRNSDYVVITLKVNGSRRMNCFAGQVNSDEK